MSLLASTINGAGYVLSNGDDKDNGNGFEFTRRKKWPQLLMQELVGSALFCVKPSVQEGTSGEKGGIQYTWKILFVSPSVEEMLEQSPTTLEGKDFIDLVHEPDRPQITKFFTNLLAPAPSPHDSDSSTTTMTSITTPSTRPQPVGTSSKSQTTYIRIDTTSSPARRGSGSKSPPGQKSSQVVWELRAHATGVEHPGEVEERAMQLGTGGNGTVSQIEGNGMDIRGKAIWVMGRAAGESTGESEGNSQSLDAFLELKLENEKLREELRELQQEYGEDDIPMPSFGDISPSRPSTSNLQPSSLSTSEEEDVSTSPSSSTPSSPDYSSMSKTAAASKPGRPPKDPAAREKKKAKKTAAQSVRAQAGNAEGGEGMHVCVTCGRTDSPEWRKGPLGPKTLCNACGLRWAKRNSSAPTRKERKAK